MALPIEARPYGTPSVVPNPAVRARPQAVPAKGESAQAAAQAFVQTLPADVRDKLGQINRDAQKKNAFSDAQQTARDVDEAAFDDENAPARATDFQGAVSEERATYSVSALAPSSTLFQAQLNAQEADLPSSGFSSYQRETYHDAYLNAGAQPGGRAAAFEAALVREELAKKTLIVPPVLTDVNFIA